MTSESCESVSFSLAYCVILSVSGRTLWRSLMAAVLETVFEHYAERFPKLARDVRELSPGAEPKFFRALSAPLAEGDEVAFLPPVSGGSAAFSTSD